MAAFLSICKLTMLLLVLAACCLQIMLIEGRQIKSMNKQERDSDWKGLQNQSAKRSNNINLHQKNTDYNDHQSTGKKKEISPIMTPKSNSGFGDSKPVSLPGFSQLPSSPDTKHFIAGSPDDFHPTVPGHSPGVGHYLLENDDDDTDSGTTAPSSRIEHSASGFKPTTPGHSPGVGHRISQDDSKVVDPKGPPAN